MNPQCFVIAVKSLGKVVLTPKSSTLQILNPNELCRTCGKGQPLSTNPFVSIFAKNSDGQILNSHLPRLFVLLQIDIQANDGLSQKMCTTCFQTFEAIGKFQKNCQQIQEIFARTANKTRDGPMGLMNFEQVSIETDLRIDEIKGRTAEIDPIGKQTDVDRGHVEEENQSSDDNIPTVCLSEELVEHKTTSKISADVTKEEDGHSNEINESNDESMSSFSEHKSKRMDKIQRGKRKLPRLPLRHCKFCNKVFRQIIGHERSCEHRNIVYCPYCFTEIPTNRELKLHIAEKHPDGKPACSICWLSFKTKRMRYEHMLKNHNEGKYVCNICNYDYRSKYGLKTHNRMVHAEKINRPCPICDKICLTQKKYNYHVKTHNPDDRRYQCEVCHRRFMQRTHLNEHRTMHSEEQKHLCSVCGKGFKRILSYTQHLKLCHGIVDEIKKPGPKLKNDNTSTCKRSKSQTSRVPCICDLCGKTYASSGYLQLHKKHVHAKHPRARCEIPNCGKTFGAKESLDTHMRKEHNIGHDQTQEYYKFSCNKCPKEFNSVAGLNLHLRFHSETGRPYECHICKYRFKGAAYLATHIKRIHAPEKKFECPNCDRKFIEKFELNLHMNVHSDLRPYKCSLCPKDFRHSRSLKDHMRSQHTDEKGYACPICPKKFAILHSLNDHVKKHSDVEKQYAEDKILNGLHDAYRTDTDEDQ